MGTDEGGERLHVAMTSEPYITAGARRAAHRLAWSLVVLFVVSASLSAGNLLYTTQKVDEANVRARAQCLQNMHISPSPVTVLLVSGKPPAKPPLGVQIVSDNRVAWRQAGCEGHLPPPDPSFLKWAHFYGLPVG
jgi:hypothetical protein